LGYAKEDSFKFKYGWWGRKKGWQYRHIESLLGIPVVLSSAKKGRGVEEIVDTIIELYESKKAKNKVFYDQRVEDRVEKLAKLLRKSPHFKDEIYSRFIAIRLLDRDENVYKIIHDLPIFIEAHNELEQMYRELEMEFDDQSTVDIFANERLAITHNLQMETLNLKEEEGSLSDKIDKFLIHPILGLPIFLFFMWGVFQLTFKLGATLWS